MEVIGVVYATGCFASFNIHRIVGRDGVSAERHISSAFEVRRGLVWRWRTFASWEDALEALGLPRQMTPGPP